MADGAILRGRLETTRRTAAPADAKGQMAMAGVRA
jgi:hypothetical protein